MVRVLLDLLRKTKKNLRTRLWRVLTRNYKGYFKNIEDLPLYNWIKLTDENNYIYVRKNIKKGSKYLDDKFYLVIFDDYLKTFGLNKMYIKLLEAMKKKALLECDYILTGDRFKLNLIELEVQNLKNMTNNNKSTTTIEQTLIYLSKWAGTWINAKNITVKEYFNLVNEFTKEQKTLKNG